MNSLSLIPAGKKAEVVAFTLRTIEPSPGRIEVKKPVLASNTWAPVLGRFRFKAVLSRGKNLLPIQPPGHAMSLICFQVMMFSARKCSAAGNVSLTRFCRDGETCRPMAATSTIPS